MATQILQRIFDIGVAQRLGLVYVLYGGARRADEVRMRARLRRGESARLARRVSEAAVGGREAARVAIFSAVARQPWGRVAGSDSFPGVHARARLALSDATAGEVAELVGRATERRRRGRRRRGERATTAARAALLARCEVRVVVVSATPRAVVIIRRARITVAISGRIVVHAVVEAGQIPRERRQPARRWQSPSVQLLTRKIARSRSHRIYHRLEGLTNW